LQKSIVKTALNMCRKCQMTYPELPAERRRWDRMIWPNKWSRNSLNFVLILEDSKKKVTLPRYTPWRHMGGEEV
jgi:hypothetical protein